MFAVSSDLEKTMIGQDEIELLEQIGSGGFSSVYVGVWRGTKVAVKRMLCTEEYPNLVEDFVREASLMSTLRHPKIVQFLAFTVKPPHVYLVLGEIRQDSN
jgi:serine/threonine protein kinase